MKTNLKRCLIRTTRKSQRQDRKKLLQNLVLAVIINSVNKAKIVIDVSG